MRLRPNRGLPTFVHVLVVVRSYSYSSSSSFCPTGKQSSTTTRTSTIKKAAGFFLIVLVLVLPGRETIEHEDETVKPGSDGTLTPTDPKPTATRATLIPSVVGKTPSLRTLANRGDRSVVRWPDYCFPLAASSHRSGTRGTEFGFAATDGGKDSPTSPPTPPGLKVRPY